MKLTYRGIRYGEAKQHSSAVVKTVKKEIIYRGNSSQARIKPNFPWSKYVIQLCQGFKSKPIFDPITFWYNHKREFVEDCWRFSDIDRLNNSWNLTIQIERDKALKLKPKTQLKYRGVTYYK